MRMRIYMNEYGNLIKSIPKDGATIVDDVSRQKCEFQYTQSNVILVDEKFIAFHQYLRYCHKSVTIVFIIPGII